MSKQKRTIAVDFDGVLHEYFGYNGGEIRGALPGARDAMEKLIAKGFEVVVFSTRDAGMIYGWLEAHGFPPLTVTNRKQPFWLILDDRAIHFDGEWSDALIDKMLGFEPYWIKSREKKKLNP